MKQSFLKLGFLIFFVGCFSTGCIPTENSIKIRGLEKAKNAQAPNDPSISCANSPLGGSTFNSCTLVAASPLDPDGGPVTYVDNSSTCSNTVVDSISGNTTFTAPSKGANCLIKLRAYDGINYSNTITSATITGANNAPSTPTLLSCLTTPNAGSTGNACLLMAAVTPDLDSDPVTYVDDSSTCTGVIVDPNSGDATFTAPAKGATCLVQVKVYDLTDYSMVVTSATITGENNTPFATAQSVNVNYNTATAVTLDGTDDDGDTIVSYTIVSAPANGSLSGTAPNLTYTPDINYTGNDSFTFRVNDGSVDSTTATVSISIVFGASSIYFCPYANANPAPDFLWSNADNWYLDSTCTATKINRTPIDGDIVHIEGDSFTDQPAAISLAGLIGKIPENNNFETANIIIQAGGFLNTTNGLWYGFSDATATVTLASTNYGGNLGTISGDATFNGNSSNRNLGVIVSNATFYNDSNNYGLIEGDATFNHTSQNIGGEIRGTATFNDNSLLMTIFNSLFSGDAIFNGGRFDFTYYPYYPGNIIFLGDVTFNSTAYTNPLGQYSGNVSFPNGATITVDGYEWAQNTTAWTGTIDWVFQNSGFNSANITGNATFNDTSYNVGPILGDVIFNGDGFNDSFITGQAAFNDNSVNDPFFAGATASVLICNTTGKCP